MDNKLPRSSPNLALKQKGSRLKRINTHVKNFDQKGLNSNEPDAELDSYGSTLSSVSAIKKKSVND